MDNKHRMASRGAAGILIIGITVFFCGLIGLFVLAQNILKLNMGHRGTDNVRGYYELNENSVSVLFLGASTMFCTVDPLVIYEEYGITSYDFGSSAQPFELTEVFLEEALKTQKPKVVAIEVLTLFNEQDYDSLNFGLTDMHFSLTKIKGVMNIFSEDRDQAIYYIFPIFQYKERWQELTAEDFKPWKNPYTMGAYAPDKISESPLDFSEYESDTEIWEVPERNRQAFDRMIKACRDREIEVVLFKSPNVGWVKGKTLGTEALADEYGLDFVNYFDLMEELDIDVSVDFRDNTHLNCYGSPKTSRYMAEYLMENYGVEDMRGSDKGRDWDKALEVKYAK